jgi:hypothetical protein
MTEVSETENTKLPAVTVLGIDLRARVLLAD